MLGTFVNFLSVAAFAIKLVERPWKVRQVWGLGIFYCLFVSFLNCDGIFDTYVISINGGDAKHKFYLEKHM